jgi:cytochrome c-type biogenesis protein
MNTTQSVSVAAAFLAGLLSFISPCVLPLVPAYITYMTGISFKEAKGKKGIAMISLVHSIFFVLGFSSIFILFGATATLLGNIAVQYQDVIRQAGGILVIAFGLYILGVLKMPLLGLAKRFEVRRKPAGLIGSFLVGMAFAAGWTPCVGPILASILIMASTAGSVQLGIMLLAVYSLGLGIPFIFASLAINTFLDWFTWFKKYLNVINIVSGIFLIIIGILLLTNSFDIMYINK